MGWGWMVMILGACTGDTPRPEPAGGDPGEGLTETGASPTDPVDFAEDVRPLLADNCARCHGESGLGPGNFLLWETASQWAEVMIDRIEAGEMPPPQADPECHPYVDDAFAHVDPALVPTLTAWIEAGKPQGDLANAPEVHVRTPTSLSRRDLVLQAPAPVAPQFVDGNEYRCFLLNEAGFASDTYVSGIEFLLDDPRISHHGILFVDPDGGSEALVEHAASKSWSCPGLIPSPEYVGLHGWAPSAGAIEFEDGMGIRIAAGQQLILQMHYYEGPEVIEDRPGYALKLEPEVERELFFLAVGPTGFEIPAGEANHTVRLDIPAFILSGLVGAPPSGLEVFGAMSHMHLLGTGYDFHATSPDGSTSCISRTDRFDFSNQPIYWFDSPVSVDSGGSVSVSCTYDNSASNPNQHTHPPQDVPWGENTQQEMCFALLYFAAAG